MEVILVQVRYLCKPLLEPWPSTAGCTSRCSPASDGTHRSRSPYPAPCREFKWCGSQRPTTTYLIMVSAYTTRKEASGRGDHRAAARANTGTDRAPRV